MSFGTVLAVIFVILYFGLVIGNCINAYKQQRYNLFGFSLMLLLVSVYILATEMGWI